MKIEKLLVLKGPNIWSITRTRLIQMILDLGNLEQRPTNTINGFYERITKLLPSLYSHRCSEGHPGGFFNRLKDGTWMGHVIEHIALEIQCMAGIETGFGRTRETVAPGVYNVVFSFVDEEAGLYAAQAAVAIAEALINDVPYDLQGTINEIKRIYSHNRLGPSTQSIVSEAEKRNIPWIRLNNHSYIQLGYGAAQRRVEATVTDATGYIAVENASDKVLTKKLLQQAGIPVPEGGVCRSLQQLEVLVHKVGFPLVIKPTDANQGKGATINVENTQQAVQAYRFAEQYSDSVIVERYIRGYDFRILVVDNKVVAAAKRMPAHVVGNGTHTVHQLVDQVNSDPARGNGHENTLTRILPDCETMTLLSKYNMNLDSVPVQGQVVYLKSTANLSTGGTAEDVTELLHPQNILLAQRAASLIGLDVCGIDVIADSLSVPLKQSGGAVLELNAAPGLRMHIQPSAGTPRNVAEPIVDMLFPDNRNGRIPIIAVTGTNGKTTTTRLIADIASKAGLKTGMTTSDGIYLQDTLVQEGDTTGPSSARFVLCDPSVEFAVLETARGGILREGLGYDCCDVGVITNITEDHLGISGIETLKDLARVKSVVTDSISSSGCAVVNAQDPYCTDIAKGLHCRVAYFAAEIDQNVTLLINSGHIVAFLNQGCLIIADQGKEVNLGPVAQMPLSMNGNAKFMIQNMLAAALAAYVWGFSPVLIAASLNSFTPGPEQTPGRMNFFNVRDFHVLVDFAHNKAGYNAIGELLSKMPVTHKIGIIAGVGDRRNDDIIECGRIASTMFDHLIIRQEKSLRGRTADEITDLLMLGIRSAETAVTCETINDEETAVRHALSIAVPGSLVVVLCDRVSRVINLVSEAAAHTDITVEVKAS